MAGDEVILPRVNGSFLCVGLQDPLLLLDRGWVSTQRCHVCISIVLVGVIVGEATLVAVNVRVTACSIDVIVNCFAWAALAATSRNVLRAHCFLDWAKCATTHRTRWVVHDREAAACHAHVRISTSAVGVVDFGAPC